ncbi:MAG: DNA-binding response OmpR family regulator [Candidatus Latescibacterota bacterium]|jgi:DNA-binding response OmpR family regulator
MTRTKESISGRILVVDDDPPVANLLQKILLRLGYEVEKANSVVDARQRLTDNHFDLVTLDIMMPGENGFAGLEWIRSHHPDIGVVMATAVDNMEAVVEVMRLGAYDYLVKPFDRDLVAAQIARAMERQHLVAENHTYQIDLEKRVADQTRDLRQTNASLRRKVRELEARDRLLHLQQTNMSIEECYPEILRTCTKALDIERALLYRLDHGELVAVAGLGKGGHLQDIRALAAIEKLPLANTDTPITKAWSEKRPFQGEGGSTAIPLVRRDSVLAVLKVEDLEDDQESRDTLWSLSSEAALLLWTTQISQDLREGSLQVSRLLDME